MVPNAQPCSRTSRIRSGGPQKTQVCLTLLLKCPFVHHSGLTARKNLVRAGLKDATNRAGVYASQTRDDFSADDVEHYFNYMGMLATEVSSRGYA